MAQQKRKKTAPTTKSKVVVSGGSGFNFKRFSRLQVGIVVAVIAVIGVGTLLLTHADSSDQYKLALTGGACLNAGQTVGAGTVSGSTTSGSTVSSSSTNKLSMLTNGNAVLYINGVAKWATNTTGTNNRLCMQTDGNLVVYSSSNQGLWISKTNYDTEYGIAYTRNHYSLQFITRNSDSSVDGLVIQVAPPSPYSYYNVWATYSRDTLDLWNNSELSTGQALTSLDGSHHAVLLDNGSFVIYHGSTIIWSSGSSDTKTPNIRTLAASEFAGNTHGLTLLNSSGTAVWSSAYPSSAYVTGTWPYKMVMQNNGNLVISSNKGAVIWASGTAGK